MHRFASKLTRRAVPALIALAALGAATPAAAALTVTPLTWNVVGLDSNTPATGPEFFPVGARVCSTTATTNVTVDYVWDSANPFVDLRPGSLAQIVFPTLAAGACADAYFEIAVTKVPAAFDTTRRYHVTASDAGGSASTPVPRELYVEHLVSQARNAVTNVFYGPVGGPLAPVAPGGAMSLVVGNQYDIRLEGGTATGGYEQFAAFINFSNTIFRITNVATTLAVTAPPRVVSPNSWLYQDACLWENDPNSPNYRACLSEGKAGGSLVATTYTIQIIGGGGSSQTLNTLLYDFSGSSFHYNADYGVGGRIANIIDPASADIAKSFTPSNTNVGGVSKLNITLTNPNAGALSGFSFVDNLPANLTIASPTGLTTSGCGTPTFTPAIVSGGTSIGFSNGTVAAGSSCVISVNVTPSAMGSLVNTTGPLSVGAVNTGKTATATLTVNNAPPPPPPLCGIPLATWNFPTGSSATAPVPSSSTVTATAAAGAGLAPTIETDTVDVGTRSWASDNIATGALVTANNEYFEFVLNTAGLDSVSLDFQAKRTSQGPQSLQLYVGSTAPGAPSTVFAVSSTAFQAFAAPTIAGINTTGNTLFRLYAFNASQNNNGHRVFLDTVTFSGCVVPQQPSIGKAFAPATVGIGAAGTSTLTLTLTNPNAAALTGAAFNDPLPAGMQVAATPGATNTCGGTWAPAAGATTLNFSGGTIPAGGSCSVTVAVIATTPGPKVNTTGSLSTTQTGTNTGPTGSATATLTALAPPSIDKTFAPSPVLPNGVSTLTFVITNPNPSIAIGQVAFADTFPVAPAAMVVAPTPNPSTSGCGAPTFSPTAGAGSIAFSGGTIAAGGTCVVRVDVSAPLVGSYVNTSTAVSHQVNAITFNGNTTTDTLVVKPPSPAVTLLKQVGASATGPWLNNLAVATGANVFYRLVVENTGDVPVTGLAVSDPAFPNLATLCSFPATLDVADAFDENHQASCIFDTGTPITALAGSHPNTATANGNGGGTPVTDQDSATYATTGLTLVKSANPTTYTTAGQTITYSFQVTNSGFATLAGPVTINDPLVGATCPAVATVGDLDNFLDPGESLTCSASYAITAADVTNGSVTNTATASADGTTSPPSSTTITTPQSADLSVDKTLTTPGPYAPGSAVTFSIVVTNAGPNAAANVSLTDSDTNLTVTNVSSGTMTCAGAAFPCTLASLANGASATVTVTATIDAVGAFSNSATVSSATPDPVPGNDSDTDGATAASADLMVSKTLDTAGPYTAGTPVTFTITVTNNGPSAATNVSVSDVDTNLTVTSVTSGTMTCTGNAFPCSLASLANGASATITVNATVDASGAFSNSATATSTTPDPVPGNNTGTDGDGTTAADLAVSKTLDTVGPYAPGASVTFTVTVTNNGPDPANNVSLTDVDANLTVTSVSSGTMTCAGASFPCTLASLANGASANVTVTATIDAVGPFSNSATAGSATPDPVPGNNTGSDGDTASSADLTVSKVLDTAGPYSAGTPVTFTVTVTNNGPSTATNVSLSDVDTNLTVTSVSSGSMTCAGNAFPCTVASLASGASATITVNATVDANGAFSNSATATSSTPDPLPGNNTGTDGDGTTAADLAVSKTLDTAGPYAPGSSVTFTVTVTNNGPDTANNVSLTDIDANLTVTNVSSDTMTCAGAAFPCTLATLANGATATVTVTATIDAVGAFSNSATATSATPDPVPGNNTGSDDDVATSADLAVTKVLDTAGPYAPGGTVSFTVTVTNNGPSTATNVSVSDVDTNLTVTSVSSGSMTCAGASFPCTLASLANGASATITVTATIDAVGAFSNSATATSNTPDPVPGNNTGSDSDTATSADLQVVKNLDTAGPYTAGTPVTFTITVTNNGPSAATNVSVSDVDSNLTVSNVSSGTLTCAGNAFPCTLASLANGASATITVNATVDANGAFSNSATATSTTPDPVPGNNTGTDGDGATSADLAVTKVLDTAGPYAPGSNVTFTVTVTNNGPDTANNVSLTDVDTNLTVTNVVSGTMTCAGNAFPCTLAGLANGASAIVTVTATVDAVGPFSNSATAGSATPDPNSGNDTGSDGDEATSADLQVLKTLDTAAPYSAGMPVTFTVTVTNNGPSAASNVSVSDVDTNLTVTNVSSGTMTCAGNAFPCTLASLANGASATVTVNATVDANGAFSNSATATSTTPDPVPGNNTGTDGAGATSADLAVTKVLDTAGPYTPGGSVTFTVNVTNNGPDAANNVVLTDVDSNLTVTGVASGSMTCAGNAFPCTLASLANGASATVAVTATIDAVGAFSNTATVTSATPDPNSGNDSGSDNDTAVSADLSVTKSVSNATPAVGTNVNFTITVANAGPSSATAVQVADPLPAGYAFVSATPSQGAFDAGAGTWTVGSLLSGANATLTIVATVNPAGPYANTATVTSGTPDPDPSDDTDTETPVPTTSADLSVSKSVSNPTPVVGSNVTFTITVANAGPSAASAVQVADPLPAGYAFVSATPSQGSYNAGTGAWTVGNLANAANATLAIVATVNASGPYANTATVTSGTPDPDPSDDTDTETPVPTPSADLAIVKTASTLSPIEGGPMSFLLTVSNTGPSAAAGVSVSDLLPAGYTFVSAAPSQGSYNAGTGVWTIGALANGAGATLTLNVTVNASGSYANTATVTSSTPDPDPTDNSDTETPIPIQGAPGQADLAVVKTNNNPSPTIGTQLTFTVAVSNTGPDTAIDVVVQDLLPAGYTFVSATPSQGSYVAGTGTWTVGTVNNGGSATLAITVTVLGSGPYANTATVSSSVPDPDPTDNVSISTPTPVAPQLMADLAVVKTGPAQIERGQQVTFNITVTNLGPDAANNSRLIDPTPAGLVFVSTAGACSGPFPCQLGNLPNGAVRNLTATYLVPADYSGPNMIVNTVTALSDSLDPTPGDTSSSSSVLVPQGQPNLATPQIVPVDARWAMLLLAVMLALFAAVRIERR